MKQILQSFKTGEMWLAEVPAPLCRPNGVVVKTVASFVSAGTERMLASFAKKNIVGKALQMPDQVKKVLRKIKTEGLWATLEKVEAKLDQPIPLGYSMSGIVVEVGSKVEGIAVGDRVACGGAGFANHAEYCSVPKNLVVKVPDNVSFEDASVATVASIALQGLRQCDLKLGETVCVIGLGLLGQLAVQMAKASGCRVIGFDTSAARVQGLRERFLNTEAQNAGTKFVAENLVGEAMAFTGGQGVDAVLITAATKSDEPVTVAAEICRKKGRVVATGLVGMNLPRDQYYKKEIDFRLSCSYGPGRYDPQYEEGGVDYPYGYVRWTEQRNMQAVVEMIASGAMKPSELITHRFAFDEALSAYEILLGVKKEPYLGIVLEYGDEKVKEKGEGERRTGDFDSGAGCAEKLKRRVDYLCSPSPSSFTSAQAVGISFLGCGNFAKAVLLPTIKKLVKHPPSTSTSSLDLSLRGVCTANGMSCGETAKKAQFAFATTDEQEVLKDAETNLVVITTRHDLHARQVKAALEAGKYVFTEKPLCISEEQLDEVERKGQGRQRNDSSSFDCSRVMVGFNRRFSPHAKLLKDYFAKRTLPLVMHYRVNAGTIPKDVWLQDPNVGGGRMVGEGCHFIDFMSYVCGAPVTKVQAMCIRTENAAETPEDSISVNLQFADGSVGTLEYVALGDTTLPKEFCEIHGEGSTATMDNFCKTVCSGKLGKRKLKGKQQKGFAEELAATVAAVKAGGAMPIPFAEIANVTRTTFAALKAVKSGECVEVG